MPSDAYKLIFQALRRREQLTFSYQGLPRECCPVILGYAADGREVLFAYQFAGATSGKTKLPQWRCFHIEGIRDLRSRSGSWLEGTSHTQAQTCVHFVDVDVNRPDTLTRKRPLAFGSDALRPPRSG
jgi:hypothetical protein